MLVLTRRISEKIVIDGVISVTLVAIQGGKARLGISAPQSVPMDRRPGRYTPGLGRPRQDDPWREDCGEA
jgi:hypothetical protein